MPLLSSTFARRTIGFLVAGLLVLVAIVGASIWLSQRTAEHAEAAVTERQQRSLASSILAAAVDAETSQRGFLLTGEQGYLVPFEDAKPKLARDLADLKVLVAGDPNWLPPSKR